ncbi:hypothetical protein R5R35_001834 [Gryllus longicercus]|uniref:Ankyrin repeat protein n=1 Tax=Gryllus longicercus TaxID=2509291 RepID=A0AAN9V8F0_9ORTH
MEFVSSQFGTEAAARALRLAALNGHAHAVRALLEGGTPVAARVPGYPSALFAAAISDPSCLAELLDAGADPHEVDAEGQTALHHAAAANHLSCARLLLAAGTDLHARSHNGLTALHLAGTDVVRRLLPPHVRSPVDDMAGPFEVASRFGAAATARPLSWP